MVRASGNPHCRFLTQEACKAFGCFRGFQHPYSGLQQRELHLLARRACMRVRRGFSQATISADRLLAGQERCRQSCLALAGSWDRTATSRFSSASGVPNLRRQRDNAVGPGLVYNAKASVTRSLVSTRPRTRARDRKLQRLTLAILDVEHWCIG